MPCIPRWKRQIRPTPRDRASENGSRGDAPCAGAGAAIAPARVWAAAQRPPKRQGSFRADACIRNGNGRFDQLHGIAPAETGQGVKPLALVAGAALAPAQVWAAAQRSPISQASFRAGAEGRPRWKRHVPQPARGRSSPPCNDAAEKVHTKTRYTDSVRYAAFRLSKRSSTQSQPFAVGRLSIENRRAPSGR